MVDMTTTPEGESGVPPEVTAPTVLQPPSGHQMTRVGFRRQAGSRVSGIADGCEDADYRKGLAAAWRQTALRRCDELDNDLLRVTGQEDAQLAPEIAAVSCLLREARWVAADLRVGPWRWWSGAEIERAWRCLREAEERLVDLVPAAELDARAARVLSKAKDGGLTTADASLLHLEALRLKAVENGTPAATLGTDEQAAYRAAIRVALHRSHARSDRDNQQARYFRNRLITASTLILAAAIALSVRVR